MLSFLPGTVRGILSALFFAGNTIFWCVFLYVLIVLRLMLPTRALKQRCSKAMIRIAEAFISLNDFGLRLFHKIQWDIEGPGDLRKDKSYLVCANHQSWVDIVAIQHVFNKRVPFLRFFIKRELIYVPLLGGAWMALDFPLMNRYSKAYLEKHPEKRGEDLATTRRACERFKGSPISVLNFLEGTRFTPGKRAKQNSPYNNLLIPKTGGVAFVLDAMGAQFDSLLDVTISYPDGVVSLWGLLSGRLKRVVVRIKREAIPQDLLHGHYFEDENFREKMQSWVRDLWDRKDKMLDGLTSAGPRSSPYP